MLSASELKLLENDKQYFIENITNPTYIQWLKSKGTNYTCYEIYMNSLGVQDKLNLKIDYVRTIIYSLHKPLEFIFFYWTVLLLILHKFNFKKPVVKIILGHFVIRSFGDILDKFGDLYSLYFVNDIVKVNGIDTITCKNNGLHPFKWFLTRQIGTVCWYTGEIIADWYPLIRTKAVIKNKSIWYVYLTCGIFNLSKISLIILHWTRNPKYLYDNQGVYQSLQENKFYFSYWVIQLIIIYTSVFYDITVYFVLKNNIFKENHSEFGFLKKFKSISEFRIIVSSIVSIIFLPLVSITIIMKFYYYFAYNYTDLNFSFEEIRKSIANVQYYMIFIDQILLIRSKHESNNMTLSEINTSINNYLNNNSSSNQSIIRDSSYYFNNLKNMNDNSLTKDHLNNSVNYKNVNHINSSINIPNNKMNDFSNNANTNVNNSINNNITNNKMDNYNNNNTNNGNKMDSYNNNNNNNNNGNGNKMDSYKKNNNINTNNYNYNYNYTISGNHHHNNINKKNSHKKIKNKNRNSNIEINEYNNRHYDLDYNNYNYDISNPNLLRNKKRNTIANYDDYTGVRQEWKYL